MIFPEGPGPACNRFCDILVGTSCVTAFYALMGTAKLNGFDSSYLRTIFTRITELPINSIGNPCARVCSNSGKQLKIRISAHLN